MCAAWRAPSCSTSRRGRARLDVTLGSQSAMSTNERVGRLVGGLKRGGISPSNNDYLNRVVLLKGGLFVRMGLVIAECAAECGNSISAFSSLLPYLGSCTVPSSLWFSCC